MQIDYAIQIKIPEMVYYIQIYSWFQIYMYVFVPILMQSVAILQKYIILLFT